MEPLDQVHTAADLNLLPSNLRLSLRSVGSTMGGMQAYKSQAERKATIQAAARKAVEQGQITLRLAVEVLETNNAYGPKGRQALAGLGEAK